MATSTTRRTTTRRTSTAKATAPAKAQPQDYKAKEQEEPVDLDRVPEFTMEVDGEEVTFVAVMSYKELLRQFGFLRRLKKAQKDNDTLEGMFLLMEGLFEEDALEALDGLAFDGEEFERIMEELDFPTF